MQYTGHVARDHKFAVPARERTEFDQSIAGLEESSKEILEVDHCAPPFLGGAVGAIECDPLDSTRPFSHSSTSDSASLRSAVSVEPYVETDQPFPGAISLPWTTP